ncbi:unnamed protein product [Vicia faba]|uniref:Uncharacterized protein n=1 Tax=Vicia faba TaxID=3906 RepID=A0AAV1AMD1_VICFA|nr:unnamed protein product [Vicia faba]
MNQHITGYVIIGKVYESVKEIGRLPTGESPGPLQQCQENRHPENNIQCESESGGFDENWRRFNMIQRWESAGIEGESWGVMVEKKVEEDQ